MTSEQKARLAGLFAAGVAATLTTSCGSGDGTGSDAGAGLQANFDSIQVNLFDQFCTSCHIGATAPGGLRLDAANSFGLLVGVASAEVPALLRVEPGNPADSYLIRKLEGTASVGGRMPLNGPALQPSDIDVVRQWITDGAQRNPLPTPPIAPIRVTSISPLPDSEILSLPLSIMAMFDRELDVSSVDATTVMIRRSGGDGTFEDGNEVDIMPVSVTVPLANPQSLVVDMSTAPAIDDVYEVTLVGTGAAVIEDLDANALDGEFTGAFPSGDGQAGGNFVARFEVTGVQPSLQSIQDNVFTTSCAGCHTGPTSNLLPAGLDLTSEAQSYAALVGVASLWVPALDRVTPGDADNSYLIQKLEGTASGGAQMPLGLMPLGQTTIDAIRQWIDDGANP
jgi:hypothetical protein